MGRTATSPAGSPVVRFQDIPYGQYSVTVTAPGYVAKVLQATAAKASRRPLWWN